MQWIEQIQNRPYIKKWLQRRLPRCHEITLTQRQIFIFPTKEGLLFVLLLLITFIAGINYGNNLILGVCFLLSGILLITIYHSYAQLSGLKIKMLDALDSAVQGQARYQIELSPTTAKSYAQIEILWQQYQRVAVVDQACVLNFDLDTPQRGIFLPPRLLLQSSFPLGLIRAWTYVYFDQQVWVAPMSLESERNPSLHLSGDGEQHDGISGQEEFQELKNYRVGESLSRVSWAHLAKGQGLLSKQFVDFHAEQEILDYAQMPATDHEARLSQLAYWVNQLSDQQLLFSLKLPSATVELGQGEHHRQLALRLLAEEP
jgi:uncharacterized protein (DUF58 family)